jgi:spermidine synthase
MTFESEGRRRVSAAGRNGIDMMNERSMDSRTRGVTRSALHFLPCLGALAALALTALGQTTVLYEKESPYSTIFVTEDARGLRTLQFERFGARQSVVKVGDPNHLELPYVRAMLVSLAMVDEPNRVLVIGLGGGTLPMFLRQHYPTLAIDVVDIDPDVVDVARKFFGFKEDDRLRAHVADGRKFIEACEEPYDLILLDAYGSDSIPYHLATREFLVATRRALTPGGVVVGNIWGQNSNVLYDSMVLTYRDVFPRVQLLGVVNAENVIVLASPRDDPIRPNEVVRRAQSLARDKPLPFDLGAVARTGFRSDPGRTEGGSILRDKP